MRFTLQPVLVGNGGDEGGVLVLTDEQRLVPVLTRLAVEYEGVTGGWYLKAGFAAQGRISKRLAAVRA